MKGAMPAVPALQRTSASSASTGHADACASGVGAVVACAHRNLLYWKTVAVLSQPVDASRFVPGGGGARALLACVRAEDCFGEHRGHADKHCRTSKSDA